MATRVTSRAQASGCDVLAVSLIKALGWAPVRNGAPASARPQ